MAGFLYFVPNHVRPVTIKDVRTWGLGYAFERPPTAGVCQNKTPTGQQGSVFGDQSRHKDGGIRMDIDSQLWRKMPRPGQQEVYVGYYTDSPPGPEDLRRAAQLNGYFLKLADGRDWLIPVARMFDEATGELKSNLPSYVDVDENGRPVKGQVMPLYAHLWELTAPYAEQMLSDSGQSPEVSDEDIAMAARSLLQVNYVVDMIEIAQLRLFSTEQTAHNIVALSVDWPTYVKWREASKKKTPSLVTTNG